MGTSKIEKFTEKQNSIANLAKALGHPARVAILEVLIKRQSCICGEIVDEIPLSQSTISQHLKELKNAGIVSGNIDGPKVCYCINPERWDQLEEILGSFVKSYKVDMNCC